MTNKIRGPHDFKVGDYALCVEDTYGVSIGGVNLVRGTGSSGVLIGGDWHDRGDFLRILTADDESMSSGAMVVQIEPGLSSHMKERITTRADMGGVSGYALKSLPNTDNDLLRTRIREARETIVKAERLICEAEGLLDE